MIPSPAQQPQREHCDHEHRCDDYECYCNHTFPCPSYKCGKDTRPHPPAPRPPCEECQYQARIDAAARTATLATQKEYLGILDSELPDYDCRARLKHLIRNSIRQSTTAEAGHRCDPCHPTQPECGPCDPRPIGICKEGTVTTIGEDETYIECHSLNECDYQASSDGSHPFCTREDAALAIAEHHRREAGAPPMTAEHLSACNGCKSNETDTVGYGYSEYTDEQLSAGKVFCTKYHGWVVPCKERQPTCGAS